MRRSRWVGVLLGLALLAAGLLVVVPGGLSPFGSLAAEVPTAPVAASAGQVVPRAVSAAPFGRVADERSPSVRDDRSGPRGDRFPDRPVGSRGGAGESPDLLAKDDELAAFVQRVEAQAAAPRPVEFTLAAFNILGTQHTAPGGSKARGYASGPVRAGWAADLVNAKELDVVGWSELQGDQYATMVRATGGRYDFWPGTALGGAGVPASLMWRTDRFEAVEKHTVTIPFLGQRRPMPVVRLRELATGREFYVMNVHNSPGRFEGERDRSEALEFEAIRTLRQQTGLPFFLTGDMNEHGEIFCNVRRATDLLAANGGSMDGGCQPPGGRPRLDWVFGSPEATFTAYLADKGPHIQRITDHAVILTSVRLD